MVREDSKWRNGGANAASVYCRDDGLDGCFLNLHLHLNLELRALGHAPATTSHAKDRVSETLNLLTDHHTSLYIQDITADDHVPYSTCNMVHAYDSNQARSCSIQHQTLGVPTHWVTHGRTVKMH
jgi:hypothetical protein